MNENLVLERGSDWYNPFFFQYKSKTYEVKDIIFFYEGEKILQCGRGWIGDRNNEHELLTTALELKMKRKIDLFANYCFFKTDGKGKFDKYIKAILYIPLPPDKYTVEKDFTYTDYVRKRHFRDKWTIKVFNYYIETIEFGRKDPLEGNINFLEKYRPFFDKLGVNISDYVLLEYEKFIKERIKCPQE